MSTLAWVVVGLAVWFVVAVLVGLLFGRVVRQRDGEVPPPRVVD